MLIVSTSSKIAHDFGKAASGSVGLFSDRLQAGSIGKADWRSTKVSVYTVGLAMLGRPQTRCHGRYRQTTSQI